MKITKKYKYFNLQKKCALEGDFSCTNMELGNITDNKQIKEKNSYMFNKTLSIKDNLCIDKLKDFYNILSIEQKSKLDKVVIDKCIGKIEYKTEFKEVK